LRARKIAGEDFSGLNNERDDLDDSLSKDVANIRARQGIHKLSTKQYGEPNRFGLEHSYGWAGKLDRDDREYQLELASKADSDSEAIEEWSRAAAVRPEAAGDYSGRDLRRLDVWCENNASTSSELREYA
jgi:hypothetical protein